MVSKLGTVKLLQTVSALLLSSPLGVGYILFIELVANYIFGLGSTCTFFINLHIFCMWEGE